MDGALDLYAESDENFEENFGQEMMTDQNQDPGVDLYNDVLGGDTPTAQVKSQPQENDGENEQVGGDGDDSSFHGHQGSSGSGRRYSIILGNLTWWTADDDLQELIDSFGIQDLLDIRIHENRSNGQSKGFAIITVGSEESSRYLQQEVPKREVQGQTPVAVPFSRQALNTFDAQSRKNEGGSGNGRNQMQNNPMMMNNQNMNMRGGMGMGPRDMGMGMGMQQRPNDQRPRMPPRLPGMPFPGMPRLPMGMGMPGAMGMGMRPFGPGMRPPMPPGMMRPDRPMMGGMEWDPTGGVGFGFPPGMTRMPVPGIPAPHVNPAFFGTQFNPMQAQQEYDQYQHASNEMGGGGSVAISLAPGSDDYENLVVQMKQVAGNAIAKAAAECKTDPSGALSKLENALLIVSTSKVSDDERVLRSIKSLQEAIEDMKSSKTISESRNGDRRSHERSRERERDSHRERSDRRRDDRDRDSRRERHRSRSKSRERRRSSDRERTRDRDRERRRESDRERERTRDGERERERHH